VMGLGWWVLLELQPSIARMTTHTTVNRKPRQWYAVVLIALVLGLSVGLGSGLSTLLTSGKVSGLGSQLILGATDQMDNNWQKIGLMTGWSDWPIWSLNFGLTSTLIGLAAGIQTYAIRLTERMHWTWSSLKRSLFAPKHLLITLFLICLTTILSMLSVWLDLRLDLASPIYYTNLTIGFGLGLNSGLTYWFLLGLFQGVTQEQVEDQHRHMFNQGIRHSLRNGVIMSIISAGLIGITSTLSFGLIQGTEYELGKMAISAPNLGLNDWLTNSLDSTHIYVSLGLWIAIASSCFIWLQSGGLTVLRHTLLRLLLSLSHILPWRTQFFLDEATAYLFLQRVGGGYTFVHRLLQEYFADLHI
jgi:uncharacterized membrane protein